MELIKTLTELAFTTTLKRVFLFSLSFGLYSIIPWLDYKFLNHSLNGSLTSVETVFGIVIGLILIFRANRSYERWWEARSLWGNLISVSRNLCIKIQSMVRLDANENQITFNFIINFSRALKKQLNHENRQTPLLNGCQLDATQLVKGFYLILNQWQERDLLTFQEFWLVDIELRNFLLILGGCERIKNTLLPISYRIFSRQIIFLFLLLLPWVFVQSFSYLVVIFSVIASYVILGLEEIAYNLENPFGLTEDHLDLEKLVNIIEKSTSEIIKKT